MHAKRRFIKPRIPITALIDQFDELRILADEIILISSLKLSFGILIS